jgi:hypothetical protein
MVVGAHKK